MYGERLFFTYTGSDGVERELTPGGVARRVTFENRLTFCRMVEQTRTHEFDAQVSDGSTVIFVPLSTRPSRRIWDLAVIYELSLPTVAMDRKA